MHKVVEQVVVRVRVLERVGVAQRGQHAAPQHARHVGQPAARRAAQHHAHAHAHTRARRAHRAVRL